MSWRRRNDLASNTYQIFVCGVSDGAVVDEDVVERLLVFPGKAINTHLTQNVTKLFPHSSVTIEIVVNIAYYDLYVDDGSDK